MTEKQKHKCAHAQTAAVYLQNRSTSMRVAP